MRYLIILFVSTLIYPISLSDIVVSSNKGVQIETSFYDSESQGDMDTVSKLWFNQISDSKYELMYDFIAPVGGFQFLINDLESLNDGDYTLEINGGETEKADFLITTNFDSTKGFQLLGFSFDGNIIQEGRGKLFNINIVEINMENELFEVNKTDNSFLNNPKHKDIDVEGIVFATASGISMDINLDCHKKLCLEDYRANINSVNPVVNFRLNPISLNTWEVLYESNKDIGGFQFTLIDASFVKASGGEAEKSDFTISLREDLILSFSFTGNVIPEGKGTLVIFEVE